MIFLLVSEDKKSYRDKYKEEGNRVVIKIQELSCLFWWNETEPPPLLLRPRSEPPAGGSPGRRQQRGCGTATAPHPLHRAVLRGPASQPQRGTVEDMSHQRQRNMGGSLPLSRMWASLADDGWYAFSRTKLEVKKNDGHHFLKCSTPFEV